MKFVAELNVVTCAQKLSQKLKNWIFERNLSNECISKEGFYCFEMKKVKEKEYFMCGGSVHEQFTRKQG